MADNVGDPLNFSLATGGSLATEGFAAAGTQVTILFNGPASSGTTLELAIDNVTFNQPLGSGEPEPGTIATLGTGLFAIFGFYLQKRRNSRLILAI